MNNLDDIERLFRLKSVGALTEEEFSRAKTEILRKGHVLPARATVSLNDAPPVNVVAGGRPQGRFEESSATKLTVGIMMFALMAGATWYVYLRHGDRQQIALPVEFQKQGEAERSSKHSAPDPSGKVWTISDTSANYGRPETDETETLECDRTRKAIKYILWWADKANGPFVRVDALGQHDVRLTPTYSEDADEMPSASVAIDAGGAVIGDVLSLRRGLRFHWANGAKETLPIPANVREFIAKCRAENEHS